MRGEVEESRIVYKSEWLEVYEESLNINNQREKSEKNNDNDGSSSGGGSGGGDKDRHGHPKNSVKIFNKIKTTNDGATIVPVFSDGSLLMVETYRRGADSVLLELPGGLIEKNDKHEETAKKELLQE